HRWLKGLSYWSPVQSSPHRKWNFIVHIRCLVYLGRARLYHSAEFGRDAHACRPRGHPTLSSRNNLKMHLISPDEFIDPAVSDPSHNGEPPTSPLTPTPDPPPPAAARRTASRLERFARPRARAPAPCRGWRWPARFRRRSGRGRPASDIAHSVTAP